MTGEAAGEATLSAEAAFAALGNETRMAILLALRETEPRSFSELREQVGMADSGQFNYHLDKLTGHFVRKTGDAYALREPGSRVIQAVLSGTVTDATVMAPTRLDAPCPLCREPIEIGFREERLVIRCTACAGSFAGTGTDARFLEEHPRGTVAVLQLPPAGLADRSPRGILETALAWTLTQNRALAGGVCPRCAGIVERTVTACDDHDGSDGVCEACGRHFGLNVDYDCTTCTHAEHTFPAGLHLLLSATDLQAFATARGVDPAGPSWEALVELLDYEEALRRREPFEASFTVRLGDDAIDLTVGAELQVVDATERLAG